MRSSRSTLSANGTVLAKDEGYIIGEVDCGAFVKIAI